LDNRLAYLAHAADGGDGRPAAGANQIFELLDARPDRQLARLDEVLKIRLPELRAGVRE
jgi:hypothetical protein